MSDNTKAVIINIRRMTLIHLPDGTKTFYYGNQPVVTLGDMTFTCEQQEGKYILRVTQPVYKPAPNQ